MRHRWVLLAIVPPALIGWLSDAAAAGVGGGEWVAPRRSGENEGEATLAKSSAGRPNASDSRAARSGDVNPPPTGGSSFTDARPTTSMQAAGGTALAVSAGAGDQEGNIRWPIRIDTPLTYPESATGDSLVVLELLIDERGLVTEAKAVAGREPFTVHAAQSAAQWRFRPALAEGRVQAVKVRFLVRFSAPAESAEQSSEGELHASGSEQNAADQPRSASGLSGTIETEVIEVTVQGRRGETVKTGLGRAEVAELPGAFGDPFRVVEVLPGVTPIASGLPFFFIRGAPPGNQGYFIDGIRVPTLYHMVLGPGVVHPALIERVDLYAGGYPARYGRFAGGVVAAETRDPESQWHGQGSVRAVDAGGFFAGPHNAGTFAAGGRYSYTALVLSLLVPDLDLEYWDYQARATHEVADDGELRAFVFGSYDALRSGLSEDTLTTNSTEFHRFDLRYEHHPDERTQWEVAATYGYDRSRGTADEFTLANHMFSGRLSGERSLGASSRVRAGVDLQSDDYSVLAHYDGLYDSDLQRAITARHDWAYGIWADVVLHPTRRITVVPGVRADLYTSAGSEALGVDPRVAATFEILPAWRLKHALGVAHQPPSLFVSIPGVTVDALADGLQRSVQHSAGTEHDLAQGLQLSLTAFQHAFFNVTDQASLISMERSPDLGVRTRGQAAGLEVMLRRELSRRVGGLVSYTLSRSWRTFDRTTAPAAFDRTHVLHLVGAYDLGRNWRAGTRFVVYTGVPASARDDTFNLVSTVRRGMPRTPAFWRFDARLQKRWPLGSEGSYAALTFELLNATFNTEVVRRRCSAFDCEDWTIGPVTLPSVGFEMGF